MESRTPQTLRTGSRVLGFTDRGLDFQGDRVREGFSAKATRPSAGISTLANEGPEKTSETKTATRRAGWHSSRIKAGRDSGSVWLTGNWILGNAWVWVFCNEGAEGGSRAERGLGVRCNGEDSRLPRSYQGGHYPPFGGSDRLTPNRGWNRSRGLATNDTTHGLRRQLDRRA